MPALEWHHCAVTCTSGRAVGTAETARQGRGRERPHIILRCLVQSQPPRIKHSAIVLWLFCVAGRHKDRWTCSSRWQTTDRGGRLAATHIWRTTTLC